MAAVVADLLARAGLYLVRIARRLGLVRPMRVAFDNNAIDKFHDADPAALWRILQCIWSRQLVMCTSEMVLTELMGLAGTGGESRLPGLAATALKLIQGHILAAPQNLLESELTGPVTVEIGQQGQDKLVSYLRLTADGMIQKSAAVIGRKALDEKQRARDELRQYVPILEDRPLGLTDRQWQSLRDKRKHRLKGITFDELRQVYGARHARGLLVMNYTKWGHGDPDELATQVLGNLRDYPHHAVWIASHAIPAYYFRALGRAPRDGDLVDHRQLIYGVDVDVFITEDVRLKEWFALLYGNHLRVMMVAEFLAEKWC